MTAEDFYEKHVGGLNVPRRLKLKAAIKIAVDSKGDRINKPGVFAESLMPWEVEPGKILPDSIDWFKSGYVSKPL